MERSAEGYTGISPLELLGRRERQVLQLVADGLSEQEIGDTLDISRKTVSAHKKHVGNIGLDARNLLGAHDTTIVISAMIIDGIQTECIQHQLPDGLAIKPLTPAEYELAPVLITGLSVKALAEKLCLSPKTVEFHKSNIKRKLGAESYFHLVARFSSLEKNDMISVYDGRGRSTS